MLSHRYEITSLLNHIKLYNTPAIKNSAPQESAAQIISMCFSEQNTNIFV